MILEQFNLAGRSALIVGGNRGLGIEMTKALAEAGAAVGIAARDGSKNEEALGLIETVGGAKKISRTCDVTDEAQVGTMVNEIHEELGSIDILVNSAGINIRGSIEEVSAEDFRNVMDVNVTGSWLTCRAVSPIMKKQEYGRVINIASMLSVIAIPDRTPYTASKGAVMNMTRALAVEWAPHKITANAILPGPFATEMNLPLLDDPEKYQNFVAKIPLGRWGELTEIGGLALFLASDASSYCTGGAFTIDGGWTAQ